MPLTPWGLSKSLFEGIKERVTTEFGRRVVEPIQTRVREELGVPSPEPHVPATTKSQKMYRIQLAGRRRVLLHMRYNGVWRYVEPYSYDTTKRKNRKFPGEPLFFAFCYKDQQIECFHISSIQDCAVTDTTFTPRADWVVEF